MVRPVLLTLLLTTVLHAETHELISWNIECTGSDPDVISAQLVELPPADIYLLQEVDGRDIADLAIAIRNAHRGPFRYYLSSLGGDHRLAMIIDERKFRIRSFTELMSFGDHQLNDWRHRSPLVAHLHRRSDGQEFLLVTVHLARGNERLRSQQADGLREWAKAQSLPIVLAGDCNFDYQFREDRGNEAYAKFFAGNVWRLVSPDPWIDTNWFDGNGDGKDDFPDSCIDLAAICPHGFEVTATSSIVVRDGDFPDNESTSDHRPLRISVEIKSAVR